MGVFTHTATYQGLRCKSTAIRFSAGLDPETVGAVEVDFKELGKLQVRPQLIPWLPASGVEAGGMISIEAWWKTTSPTVTTVPRPTPVLGNGLDLFGDLVLKSYLDGEEFDGQTYNYVYVDESGIEEVTRGSAEQNVLHDRGTVRVPLTDIRAWYQSCAAFFGRINRKTRSGAWDKLSILDGTTPWTLQQVVQFLFSQLPGGPRVVANCALYDKKHADEIPVDIVGSGEPVVQVLSVLLERYGLVPQRQPDGNYSLSARAAADPAPRAIAKAVGLYSTPTYISSDLRDVYTPRRPAAITAVGPKVIERMTVLCAACLQDVDGTWWRLDKLMEKWGYPLETLNREIMNGHEKRYHNVPPTSGDPEAARLHYRRRKLLEGAYKYFAPAIFFDPDTGRLTDPDFETMPFLPMTDVALRSQELDELPDRYPQDKGKADPAGGASDGTLKFKIVPPVVFGTRITQHFFTDFVEVEKWYVDFRTAHVRWYVDAFQEEVDKLKALILDYGQKLLNATSSLKRGASKEAVKKWGTKADIWETRDHADVDRAVDAVKGFAHTVYGDVLKEMTIEGRNILSEISQTLKNKEEFEKSLADAQERLVKMDAEQDARRKAWSGIGGLPLWANQPPHMIENKLYDLDRRTGILRFSEPVILMREPFTFTRENATTLGAGFVTITFGYESNRNSVFDWTTVTMIPSTLGADAIPQVVSVREPSPIRSKTVPINSRLYVLDSGTPVNLAAVVAEARQKCGSAFAYPASVEACKLTLTGFRKAVLDGSVQGVQHVFDGSLAYTVVATNSPNARMPLGPPIPVATLSKYRTFIREEIEKYEVARE